MEQQAWILRRFLAQLKSKEAEEEEAENGFSGEFLRLKKQSSKYRTDKTYLTKTAEKQENIKKNRYKDILPFDHSRVKLNLTTSINDSDYINASFLKGASGSRAYIATQGPLPHTVLDFWRMMWEYNIKVVVMACREVEMGRKKCERYWPKKEDESFVCEPFTVYCDFEENKGDYLSRTLRVTYNGCSRDVHQLHYINWPDHGIPDSIPPILDMLLEMRSHQAHEEVPICIHCSAGCGRTGALCAIDYTWNLLKKQLIPEDFSIFDLIQNMRTQRPSMVQTKEQYELVYRTIRFLFERYLHFVAENNSTEEVPFNSSPGEHSEVSVEPDCDWEQRLDSHHHFDQEAQQSLPVIEEYRPIPDNVAQSTTPELPLDCDVLPESESHIHYPCDILAALTARDKEREQQRHCVPHNLPNIVASHQEHRIGPGFLEPSRTTPPHEQANQRGPGIEDRTDWRDGVSPQAAPIPSITVMCLTVEDPYFDSPLNSPTPPEEAPLLSSEGPATSSQWMDSPVSNTPSLALNDHILAPPMVTCLTSAVTPVDEDKAPPLPQRTPESYILAGDAEPCTLEITIPPNAVAEGLEETRAGPPSPVPPLPERTPESYELAVDEDQCNDTFPTEQELSVKPAADLSRIGVSSEWSGNSLSPKTQTEPNTWTRSKSLKVKMNVTTQALVTPLASSSDATSHNPPSLPPKPPALPFSPLDCENDGPPLPDRTPASFTLVQEVDTNAVGPHSSDATGLPHKIGTSSEWAGSSQPKSFLDIVKTRSKSVRIKGTTQAVSLPPAQQTAPTTVDVTRGGSAEGGLQEENHRDFLSTNVPENMSHKNNGKGMSRTKSLRFFKSFGKSKTGPLQPPAHPMLPPSNGDSSSGFRLGFGLRFGKPKGPRRRPESWV